MEKHHLKSIAPAAEEKQKLSGYREIQSQMLKFEIFIWIFYQKVKKILKIFTTPSNVM